MDKKLLTLGVLIERSGFASHNKEAAEFLSALKKQAGMDKLAMLPTKWDSPAKKQEYGEMPLDTLQHFFVQMWWGAMVKLGTTTVQPPAELKMTNMKFIDRFLGAPLKASSNPKPNTEINQLWASLKEAWNRHRTDYESAWNRIWFRAYNATSYVRGTRSYPTTEARNQAESEQSVAVFDKYFKGNSLFNFVLKLNLGSLESVFEQTSALIVSNIANGNVSSKSVKSISTDFSAPEDEDGGGAGDAYNFTYEDAVINYPSKPRAVTEKLLGDDGTWQAFINEAVKNDASFMADLNGVIKDALEIPAMSEDVLLSTRITSLPQMEILATLIDDCISPLATRRIQNTDRNAISSGGYAVLYAYLALSGVTFEVAGGGTTTVKLSVNPFLLNFRELQRVAPEFRKAADFGGLVASLWASVERYMPTKLLVMNQAVFTTQMIKFVWGGSGIAPYQSEKFPEGPMKAGRRYFAACLKEFIRLRLILEVSNRQVLADAEPGLKGSTCVDALRAITMAPKSVIDVARTLLIQDLVGMK